MLYRETAPDEFAPWNGEPLATTLQRPVPVLDEEGAPVLDEQDNPVTELQDYVDDVRYPASIEQLWSDAELAAIDLYRPAAADPVPDGKVATSTGVERVEGVVKYVHVLADAPPVVIDRVSMRQTQLALLNAGLLSQVETAIAGLAEPERSRTQIEWKTATELRRDHAMVALLAAALSLTEPDIDALFYEASQIV